MNRSNQRYWDAMSPDWQKLRDQDNLWQQIPQHPELAFDGEAFPMLQRFLGDLHGKNACVIGSGDNYVAFALAGMGALVTSTDISARQLEVARSRATLLNQEITFLQADATILPGLASDQFDLVCSSNGFFVWIAEPAKVFQQVHRVLKPGGYYIFYDVHPFLRPWKDPHSPRPSGEDQGDGSDSPHLSGEGSRVRALEMENPYSATGPFEFEDYGHKNYQFHWRLSDLLNPLLASGLVLRQLAESPARDPRFWEGMSYTPGVDQRLLDWHTNPLAGLPAWLTVAAQKN